MLCFISPLKTIYTLDITFNYKMLHRFGTFFHNSWWTIRKWLRNRKDLAGVQENCAETTSSGRSPCRTPLTRVQGLLVCVLTESDTTDFIISSWSTNTASVARAWDKHAKTPSKTRDSDDNREQLTYLPDASPRLKVRVERGGDWIFVRLVVAPGEVEGTTTHPPNWT